jgi:hypothetical protein
MTCQWNFVWCLMLLAAAPIRGARADGPSWELSRYNVQLIAAVDPGLPLAPDVAADLPSRCAAPLAAALGAAGRVEAHVASPELRASMLSNLPAITAADLPAERLAGDKVMLVAVTGRSGRLLVQARELDVATGLWNTMIAHDAVRPEQLVATAARSGLAAFAPLARIESTDGGTASLKFRGGALLPAGRGLPGGPGAVYRPLLAKSDSRGKIEAGSAASLPWTYLTVTSASGSEATCRIDTGLAGNAIPAYHPLRPRLALAVAPPVGTTRLKLVTAGAPNVPLEGCTVLTQPAGIPGGGSWQRVGASDARGMVSVPAGAAIVQMLLIRQGERPLARVPIVAGLVDELSLALADDSQRVEIEQSLAEVNDELLDLAARREALVARGKLAKAADDTAALDKLKSQLGALPDASAIATRLEQAAAALKAADAGTQSALQPQIDALKKALDLLAQARGNETG